jgi:UDP-N-acetylglucosamine:LPS N-acetylglucosamine transferase
LSELAAGFKPDAVVGFGGYVSSPVYRVAARAGVPIVVHEANAKPGLANRWGAKHAAGVGVAFPGTNLPGAQLVGMPLRAQVARLGLSKPRAEARDLLGLRADGPVLLVAGGSLGAANINQAILAQAERLTAAGVEVLHLTGRGKAGPVKQALQAISQPDRYHVIEYLEEMELALAAADLAVQRAGAASVCELACAALPAVLVPLAIGNGEQRLNAAGLARAGGAIVVDDSDLAAWAAERLIPLVTDSSRLEAMSKAASTVAIADGAGRLADLIEAVVGG